MHRVASEIMGNLGYSSKLNAEWDFLRKLRDAGGALRPRLMIVGSSRRQRQKV